ncbi:MULTISPECIES: NgoPII family restriction endonuclease [Snodgrassella]|uniref:NgoPII family restriction endonuclease n=1 Tax=Snodgrassella TaxID=1193515 RepID=UPI000BBDA917|nr:MULTISPECIES: NgoPII family restriction endonuclease [Snodgrassella]MBI0098546.1 NgoPII family restriction endonuclease [Snodgrassella sp. W8134]MBI0102277.1 NgoPII family restriction endonuclease [Snodgrassella sp. W8135]PCL20469.1 restriction endonuclease [Snodgrassella alvi]
MKTNLIKAIVHLVKLPIIQIVKMNEGKNRANNQGEGLEKFIIDLFCGTFNETNEQIRLEKRCELFSYLGNQNNPPDAMIRAGDAIEIKKIETFGAPLALNSSYPKAKLYPDNPMLATACVSCEDWVEKDIIYAIGQINKQNILNSLCFVYGIDYADNLETYERIKLKIKEGILTIDEVEFSETKELGRVNKVDTLGITYLRIRGMWHIENPIKVFNYIYQPQKQATFNLMALINIDKYMSFSEEDRNELEKTEKYLENLVIKDVRIKCPDNPAQLKDAKLITFFLQ